MTERTKQLCVITVRKNSMEHKSFTIVYGWLSAFSVFCQLFFLNLDPLFSKLVSCIQDYNPCQCFPILKPYLTVLPYAEFVVSFGANLILTSANSD